MKYPKIIHDRIIQTNFTILQSLKKMDKINKKLLLVFDKETFVGVLSIGDIQKAIIANMSLDTCITEIMRKDFVFAKTSDDKKTVLQMMQEHRIECMPILDENLQLVSVYVWDDVFVTKKRNDGIQLKLPVIIMAGGQGTRLKPLTNVLPKPLIPIRSKTIIEEIMDRFVDCGCNDFFLSVNHKAEIIRYYLDSLRNPEYRINYFQEDKPLGTAGSLHLLKDKIRSTFFVSNCDIIIEQDYSEILNYHSKNNNEITVVAALKNYSIPYGTLTTREDGLLQTIQEKPEIIFKINTGFYILEPHLIKEIPDNQVYHITYLIEKLQQENRRVGVFPVSEKSWTDIGNWEEYLTHIRVNHG